MVKELEMLSPEEIQLMLDAMPYITILVAGADGEIDRKELKWGEKLTKIRAFAYEEELRPFYQEVEINYEERLYQLMADLPGEKDHRNRLISEELAKINQILPKLDHFFARLYYKSLRSFAEHVAHASGGIMGWMTIGFEEYKIIDLPMIQPIK